MFTPAKLKVAELRKELQNRGLDTSGLKKDLVDRLEAAIDSPSVTKPGAAATRRTRASELQASESGRTPRKTRTGKQPDDKEVLENGRSPSPLREADKGDKEMKEDKPDVEDAVAEEPKVEASSKKTKAETEKRKSPAGRQTSPSPKRTVSKKQQQEEEEVAVDYEEETNVEKEQQQAPKTLPKRGRAARQKSQGETQKPQNTSPLSELPFANESSVEEVIMADSPTKDLKRKSPSPSRPSRPDQESFQTAEQTAEAPRKRKLSEDEGDAKKPKLTPSLIIQVRNLVRPYTTAALQALLSEAGNFSGFWTDARKSTCFATYSSMEESALAVEKIHGIAWPQPNCKPLECVYVSEEEVQRLKDEVNQQKRPSVTTMAPRGKGIGGMFARATHAAAQSTAHVEIRTPVEDKPMPDVESRSTNTPVEERPSLPSVDLDSLFKKTTATPIIYYLPLTDEQVAEKRRKREEAKATAAAAEQDKTIVSEPSQQGESVESSQDNIQASPDSAATSQDHHHDTVVVDTSMTDAE